MSGIALGSTQIYGGKVKLGAGDISKVYAGGVQVWPAAPQVAVVDNWQFYSPDGAAGFPKSKSFNFGPASAGRIIVACISTQDGDPCYVENVTIGGVTATILAKASIANRIAMGIFAAVVPAGTSGVISWYAYSWKDDRPDANTVDVFALSNGTLAGASGGAFSPGAATPANYTTIGFAGVWGGSVISNWAAPFVIGPVHAPQGYTTTAYLDTGAASNIHINLSAGQDVHYLRAQFPRA